MSTKDPRGTAQAERSNARPLSHGMIMAELVPPDQGDFVPVFRTSDIMVAFLGSVVQQRVFPELRWMAEAVGWPLVCGPPRLAELPLVDDHLYSRTRGALHDHGPRVLADFRTRVLPEAHYASKGVIVVPRHVVGYDKVLRALVLEVVDGSGARQRESVLIATRRLSLWKDLLSGRRPRRPPLTGPAPTLSP